MTGEEIVNLFAGASFPVADTVIEEGTPCPFGILKFSDTANSFADNKTFCINNDVTLEVYTLGKSYALIDEVGNILNNACLPFTHDTADDSAQQVFIEYFNFGEPSGSVPTPPPEPDPPTPPTPEPDPEEDPEPEEDTEG